MSSLDITQLTTSDMTNQLGNIAVASKDIDMPTGQKETEWQNTRWTQQYGYFLQIPDLKSALILKAVWIVGRGYTADPETTVILDHISGTGKQTFRDILFTQKLLAMVGGASYAEIIRGDDKMKTLVNLKPLNPGCMKEIYDDMGMLLRYEYVTYVGKDSIVTKFDPERIFALYNCKMGMHGISEIDALERTILADNENFEDMKLIMHHIARPLIIFKLKTDNATTIAAVRNKIDTAMKYGENCYVPDDENIVSWEVVQISVPAELLAWRDDMRNRFYRAIGLPQIVPGGSGQSTQSEANVIYLAHELIVENEQRYIEEQVWNQLYLRIELNAPESMSPMLQQNAAKNGAPIQPGEMNPAAGRQ